MRRKTQYSSETGRIIPPTSWRTKRRDFHTPNTHPGARTPQASQIQPGTISLEGQELRVTHLNTPNTHQHTQTHFNTTKHISTHPNTP